MRTPQATRLSTIVPFIAFATVIGTLLAGSASAGEGARVTALTRASDTLGGNQEILGFGILSPEPMNPQTITCDEGAWMYGRISGKAIGKYVFFDGNRQMYFYANKPFAAGERLTILVSKFVEDVNGDPITGGIWIDVWNGSAPATRTFTQIQSLSTNIASESSRPYGGSPCDLDGDGFADLAIINEDTNDVRVMMNMAQCTAALSGISLPFFPTGSTGSPNEAADFNRDGKIDLCVANVGSSSVSILLGNGDGTFAPHQEIASGVDPHGIAVLDADCDGDLDVAVANNGSSDVGLILNDGLGVFGAATFFDAGVSWEWAIGAADMNSDDICDLVVGSQGSSQISVLTGNGDGTFALASVRPSGGSTWMLALGDLNNDFAIDVTTANSASNTGSVLMGNGDGTLDPAVTYPIGSFGIATDLADLDGDYDLDWVTASFGGDYHVFENQGNGTFLLDQTIPPPSNGSCTVLVDLDNDLDVDLITIDEISDIVEVFRNDDEGADCNGNTTPDACDLAGGVEQDCNGNRTPDSCDIVAGTSEDAGGNGIPDECETSVANCGPGAVDIACGERTNILFANALYGSRLRQLDIGTAEPLSIGINEPPARQCDGTTTRCCVYAWVGTPGVSDEVMVPRNLGTMCYGPLVITTKLPKKIWNSIGMVNKLGADNGPGAPPVIEDGATFELVYLEDGLGRAAVVTLQGIVQDPCTQGTVPYSVTNGLTLVIQ